MLLVCELSVQDKEKESKMDEIKLKSFSCYVQFEKKNCEKKKINSNILQRFKMRVNEKVKQLKQDRKKVVSLSDKKHMHT